MGAHNSIRRYLHRIGEEIRSTAEIAKLTSWPAAVETLIAKADIQIMCRNGYAEPPNARRRLIRKHETLLKYFEKRYGDFASGYRYKVIFQPYRRNSKVASGYAGGKGLTMLRVSSNAV